MPENAEVCLTFCPNRADCAKRLAIALREGATLETQDNAWKLAAITFPMYAAERQADLMIKGAGLEIQIEAKELVDTAQPDVGTVVRSDLDYQKEGLDLEGARLERDEQVIADTLEDLAERRIKNTVETTILQDVETAIEAVSTECDGPVLSFAGRLVMKWDQLLGRPADTDLYLAQYARCSNDEVVALTEDMPDVTRQYIPSTESGR